MGGGAGLMTEVLRSLAMEFLAKMRAKVDQVLFFELGLKIKASRACSRLGLKPKLFLGRLRHKRKACGLLLRPGPLVANSRGKTKDGDDRAAEPNLGQGGVFAGEGAAGERDSAGLGNFVRSIFFCEVFALARTS
jgi:hypothetical protein